MDDYDEIQTDEGVVKVILPDEKDWHKLEAAVKKNYNTRYLRNFKCRLVGCKGIGTYNLQEVSQEGFALLTCSACGKEWRAEKSEKSSCCGRMVVRFTSVEKNINVKPLVVLEGVRKE